MHRGYSKGECEGILIIDGYKGSLLNLWKGERVVRVVDFRLLERRSLVNAGGLDGRGIGSGHRLWWLNHYKTRFVFLFCYLPLLQIVLLAYYILTNVFKLNIFLIWFCQTRLLNHRNLYECTNSPPHLSADFGPNNWYQSHISLWVKESKINLLMHNFDLVRMKLSKTIIDKYTRFTNVINGLKAYGKYFTNLELVNKILRSLPKS